MSVAMAVGGCCSTAQTTVREDRGQWTALEAREQGLCNPKSVFGLDAAPLPSPALPPGSVLLLSQPDRVSPSLSSPFPEKLLSGSEQGRSWDLGGFKRLGKNLPPGISFLHLPGINCVMEVEALQLHGELLRAKRVEAKTLPVPPRCGHGVLKGPRKGEESSLSCGSM